MSIKKAISQDISLDGVKPAVTKEQIVESISTIEKSAGFLIRIAELTVFEELYKRFKGGEVSIGEFTVLRAIGLNPNLRQGVLADALHIKWPSMTKMVNSLELRRLLKRVVPLHNRRSIELVLTPEGEAVVAEYAPEFKNAETEIFTTLDDEEYLQLENLLRKVAGWPHK